MAGVLYVPVSAIAVIQVVDAAAAGRRSLRTSSVSVVFSVDAPSSSAASALATNITAISPAALVSTLQSYGLTACTGVVLSAPVITEAPSPPSPPTSGAGLSRQAVLGIAIGVSIGGAALFGGLIFLVWRHVRQARATGEAAEAEKSFGGGKADAKRIPDTPVSTSRADRHTNNGGERRTAAGAVLSTREVRALANARTCLSCGASALAVRTKVGDEQRREDLYVRCRSCHAKFKPAELR